eukprot:CAMPEP_0113685196 /NCGR_PEP_ID=MMETSP0038_2-20120614/14512_1 /TAXON_ID=2898 /ORGANISM="Cryptomonas paramecium" /LENGTH=272 /DNA_ID=CAMNT_0000605205 /DNA_START=425 /DNA_END=1243 /DNA_ORIENTATION=- /assembly_acc=CAM_ASM_000170
MVASKFFDDELVPYPRWAEIGGIPPSELCNLEMAFLDGIGFHLFLRVAEIRARLEDLDSFSSSVHSDTSDVVAVSLDVPISLECPCEPAEERILINPKFSQRLSSKPSTPLADSGRSSEEFFKFCIDEQASLDVLLPSGQNDSSRNLLLNGSSRNILLSNNEILKAPPLPQNLSPSNVHDAFLPNSASPLDNSAPSAITSASEVPVEHLYIRSEECILPPECLLACDQGPKPKLDESTKVIRQRRRPKFKIITKQDSPLPSAAQLLRFEGLA